MTLSCNYGNSNWSWRTAGWNRHTRGWVARIIPCARILSIKGNVCKNLLKTSQTHIFIIWSTRKKKGHCNIENDQSKYQRRFLKNILHKKTVKKIKYYLRQTRWLQILSNARSGLPKANTKKARRHNKTLSYKIKHFRCIDLDFIASNFHITGSNKVPIKSDPRSA